MEAKNPAAVALGQRTSPRKAVSSAMNGQLGGRPRNPHTPESFWARVTKLDNGCWRLGRTQEGYYGTALVNGIMAPAHRHAYILTHGPIPNGLLVLHNCDRPNCCNPDHLRLGTHKENTADMLIRRRQNNWSRGPRLPRGPKGTDRAR